MTPFSFCDILHVGKFRFIMLYAQAAKGTFYSNSILWNIFVDYLIFFVKK